MVDEHTQRAVFSTLDWIGVVGAVIAASTAAVAFTLIAVYQPIFQMAGAIRP